MTQIIILFFCSIFLLFLFVFCLILGIKIGNLFLKIFSFIALTGFFGLFGYSSFLFVTKTIDKVQSTFDERSGDEIYEALFDKKETDCVKVLHYQDQVIPKIDVAIWLHVKTCPTEVKRILRKHEFSRKIEIHQKSTIPLTDNIYWFKPEELGDTIIVFKYSSKNAKNIQTLWINMDSTEVFCRDILD